MQAFTYTLFSKKLDHYYLRLTELLPKQRLKKHLTTYYGNNKIVPTYL